MKLEWLKDSLSFNGGKPIDETTKTYAWEPKHASKVAKKLKIEKAEAQRRARHEAARRQQLMTQASSSNDDNSDEGDNEAQSAPKRQRRTGDHRKSSLSTFATSGISETICSLRSGRVNNPSRYAV